MIGVPAVSRISASVVIGAVALWGCTHDYAVTELAPGSLGGGDEASSTGATPSSGSGQGDGSGGGGMAQDLVGGMGGGTGGARVGAGGEPTGGAGGASTGGGRGSGTGGAAPVASCADQYPGHMLCVETSGSCEMYVFLNQVISCAEHCTVFGGECIEVWDDVGNSCDHLGPLTCSGKNGDALCVCSLGCGSGPACAPGSTCSGGSCL